MIHFYRFREGMKTLGVLDAIRMHPDAFRPLFCHEPSPLTADVLELSAVGRNKRRAEECVHFGGTTCWMLRVSIIASYGIKIFSYALLSVFVFPSFLKVFYMLGLIYFLVFFGVFLFQRKRDPCNLGVSWPLRREQTIFHPWASPHYLQWFFSMSCPSDKAVIYPPQTHALTACGCQS